MFLSIYLWCSQISSGQENNGQSIAVIRQAPSNPNFFLASQPISTSSRQTHQTQTYRLVTTDEVRTLGGTSGSGGHGHLQNMRPQMVNQNTPQVANQTGQQVIQYIPQSPQPTGNIITIMPTNSNWSNQVRYNKKHFNSLIIIFSKCSRLRQSEGEINLLLLFETKEDSNPHESRLVK